MKDVLGHNTSLMTAKVGGGRPPLRRHMDKNQSAVSVSKAYNIDNPGGGIYVQSFRCLLRGPRFCFKIGGRFWLPLLLQKWLQPLGGTEATSGTEIEAASGTEVEAKGGLHF